MFKTGHKHSDKWYSVMASLEFRKLQQRNALILDYKSRLVPQYGNKVNLGRKHTEEQKEKISNWMKKNCPWRGKERSEVHKKKLSKALMGRISPMKGKHQSEEAKEKLRQFNWKGGLNLELYPLGWNHNFKNQVRSRDGYKCRICGVPQAECIRNLCVHHIDYNKKNINLDNLITLCIKCHSKTNHNRQKWENEFKRTI